MINDLEGELFLKLISNNQSILEPFEAEIRADEEMKIIKEFEEKESKPSSTKKQQHTRITKELRKEVLRMIGNGRTHKEISVLTGLCFPSITKIKHGK